MYTKSSESVLTSLSTVVTQLIDLVAQSNANGGGLPRLDSLSQGVVSQVNVLGQVSTTIMKLPGSDDKLKTEMAGGVGLGNLHSS